MIIHTYSENWKDKWDKYVQNSSRSTFFHNSGWKNVVEKTFGHKSYYLLAESDGVVCGILPSFIIKSAMFGHSLISVPFATYGGICADNTRVEHLLLQEAIKLVDKKKMDYLELRNFNKGSNDLFCKELYETFIKELPQDSERCLSNLPRKARAAARKGIVSGLKTEINVEKLGEFYELFAMNKRCLGSPVLPLSFFENIMTEFRNQVTIFFVKYKNEAAASVMTFLFKNTIMPYYSGSLDEYSRYQTNNFMYLKLMEYGVENNYRYFDFGRSKKETGSYKFKINQGFKPKQLYYQYYLNRAKKIPDITPVNPKFNLAIKTWQRFPLSVTKWLGPKIVKYIP